MIYHKPVLLKESVDGLNIKPKGIYVDLTFGGGGHSREILARLGKNGRLLAFDQDKDARENIPEDPRITFIHANFRFLKNFLRYYGIEKLDGIIADLGISSHQIDEKNRGFTFRQNASLDMRMNRGSDLTAEKILNEYPGSDLLRIFRVYGELRGAHRFVLRIEQGREKKRIKDSHALIEILGNLVKGPQSNKTLARLYQALRIEVNDEMIALEEMLKQVPDVLKDEGRLVVLSYQSIEDRMVKNLIKTGNIEGELEKDFFGKQKLLFKAVNRNIITASEEEIKENPRSRSAKLRIAERIYE
ncbi:MAG: 16S rRNA (cytosine(1402)-N(4))-methyltransferase RsmH [Bacteroidales bacterium]